MTRWIVMVMMLGACSLLQLLTPPWAILGQVKIPFLTALVVYYALNWEGATLLVAGLLGGLMGDVLSPVPLGYHAALLCGFAWIANRFRDLVLTDSPLTPAVFGAAGAGASTLLVYALLSRDGLVHHSLAMAIWRTLGASLLGFLCTPPIYALTGLLDRWVGNIEIREATDAME